MMIKKTLFLDIETYSECDLKDVDIKKYTQSNFEIMLIGYNYNMTDTHIIDFTLDTDLTSSIPKLLKDLSDPSVKKIAHNAFFEFTCFSQAYPYVPSFDLYQWVCTMQLAYQLNLPGGLGPLGKVLNLDKKKIEEGKDLLRFFCKPCKPTKTNGQSTRNLSKNYPEKWEQFKKYCKRDVDTEIEIYKKLSFIENTPDSFEKKLWVVDYNINNSGIYMDRTLIKNAIDADTSHKNYVKDKFKNLSGLENPNSFEQLKNWIAKIEGMRFPCLDKNHIDGVINVCTNEKVKEVLELKKQLGKTSVAKYQNAYNNMSFDRVHFLFRFNHAFTGRWAGTFVQPHNLPRNKLKNIEEIRNKYLNKTYNIEDKQIPFELSQLIRTMFIPKIWHKFFIVDYSQIESRVAAWVAGEDWVLNAFKEGRDIYVETAAKMYEMSREEIDEELRQDGKRAVLACGYGGGEQAVLRFAPDMIEEKRQIIVNSYRIANSKIVATWRLLDKIAKVVTVDKHLKYTISINQNAKIVIYQKKGCLFIQLPSGRPIVYPRIKLEDGQLYYESLDGTTKQWAPTKTYGGKLFENICQAIARDILAAAIVKLDDNEYNIKLHVHDEIVCEVSEHTKDEEIKDMEEIMCKPLVWSEGLPLEAKGFVSKYYMKE